MAQLVNFDSLVGELLLNRLRDSYPNVSEDDLVTQVNEVLATYADSVAGMIFLSLVSDDNHSNCCDDDCEDCECDDSDGYEDSYNDEDDE